jgi:hypothetical protein
MIEDKFPSGPPFPQQEGASSFFFLFKLVRVRWSSEKKKDGKRLGVFGG